MANTTRIGHARIGAAWIGVACIGAARTGLGALLLAAAATATVAVAADAIAVTAPPPARTVDAVDRRAGLTLPDPYRWMEGDKNPEFLRWVTAEGAATRTRLDALPTLAAWQARLKAVSGDTRNNTHQVRRGERVFFLRGEGSRRAVLMVRDGDGRERVLVDPAQMPGATDKASITEFNPSADGARVAVNVDAGGTEVTRIHVIEVADGRRLADAVEPVWGEFVANWLNDGSGFFYSQLAPENERPNGDIQQNTHVRFHRMGTPVAQDPLLIVAGRRPGISDDNREFLTIATAPGSDWAVLAGNGARPESRLCMARTSAAMKADAAWRCIVGYADGVQGAALRGDTLYLLSMHDDPNGTILSLDLSKPQPTLADARVVLPASKDAVVSGVVAARDALYVKRSVIGIDGLIRVGYDDRKVTAIDMPLRGRIRVFDGAPGEDGAVFSLEGWTSALKTYAIDTPARGAGAPVPVTPALRDLRLGTDSPADYADIVSEDTEAVSADGTRVPLTILHRKDVRRDGRNRALITGYGFAGIVYQPAFSPTILEWVKAGNVFAVAHVRGGGEKGEAWHLAGKGAQKHRGAEDFIACAAALSTQRYTTPERTAATGRSGGGLLMGDVITRAPETFGAFVIGVGVLDPVRMLEGVNGANLVAEFGDPRTDDGLQVVAAMDPYQHLRAGTAYPPVLLPIGLNDNRVATWHTGKFAARLRAANSDHNAPVWIRVDPDVGHFGNPTPVGAAMDRADEYAFLDAQLPGR